VYHPHSSVPESNTDKENLSIL
jgi:serine/threonine protein kinase